MFKIGRNAVKYPHEHCMGEAHWKNIIDVTSFTHTKKHTTVTNPNRFNETGHISFQLGLHLMLGKIQISCCDDVYSTVCTVTFLLRLRVPNLPNTESLYTHGINKPGQRPLDERRELRPRHKTLFYSRLSGERRVNSGVCVHAHACVCLCERVHPCVATDGWWKGVFSFNELPDE